MLLVRTGAGRRWIVTIDARCSGRGPRGVRRFAAPACSTGERDRESRLSETTVSGVDCCGGPCGDQRRVWWQIGRASEIPTPAGLTFCMCMGHVASSCSVIFGWWMLLSASLGVFQGRLNHSPGHVHGGVPRARWVARARRAHSRRSCPSVSGQARSRSGHVWGSLGRLGGLVLEAAANFVQPFPRGLLDCPRHHTKMRSPDAPKGRVA